MGPGPDRSNLYDYNILLCIVIPLEKRESGISGIYYYTIMPVSDIMYLPILLSIINSKSEVI